MAVGSVALSSEVPWAELPRVEFEENLTVDGVLGKLLNIQGLLARFTDPQVRADLLGGLFNAPYDSDQLLFCLDEIRRVLLPAPRTTPEIGIVNVARMKFVNNLLLGKTTHPADLEGNYLPLDLKFCDWAQILSNLGSSPYWDRKETYTRRPVGLKTSSPHQGNGDQNRHVRGPRQTEWTSHTFTGLLVSSEYL